VLAERVEAHAVSIVLRMGFVQVQTDGAVATARFCNPGKKNAIPSAAWPELEATFRSLAVTPGVHCVVLTGEGDDFSSGADVSPGGPAREEHALVFMRSVARAVEALHNLPQPGIARVAGVCVGAALNLALACDLIVASDDARFSEIFARRGLSIDGGGSWILPRVVGLHRAKELALLADIIPASEAERIGLVNRVVPRPDLDATVASLAARLAAGPPLALSITKRLLNQSAHVSLAQALEAEAQAQAVNLSSRDTAEAMLAFAERRDPKFEGR
jgi:enoyl-CoA hydratase/carnithine racemase